MYAYGIEEKELQITKKLLYHIVIVPLWHSNRNIYLVYIISTTYKTEQQTKKIMPFRAPN